MHLSNPSRSSFVLGLLAVLCMPLQAQAQLKAFTNARIIDGSGSAPIANGVMVVRDGRLQAVGTAEAVSVPEEADVIDLEGAIVMPGLINAHGHVGTDTEGKLLTSARYGVTTVVSLGGEDIRHVRLRNSQDHPQLDRARLYLAGPVQEFRTPEAAAQGIREIVELQADWVKTRVQNSNVPEDAYAVVIEEAHRNGMKVAAHMYTLEDTKGLLRRQVDVLAHSVRDQEMDAESIQMMQARDICITPTLTREVSTYVYESRPDFFDDPFFIKEADQRVVELLLEPEYQSRMAANAQQGKDDLAMAQHNLKLLHDAGIRIALGTDSGAFDGRWVGYFEHMEMSLMAEAGMEPMQIIRSATSVAADCMDLTDVGLLEPGRWADFIVLDADPLLNIDNSRSLRSVWVAGNRVPGS